MTLKWSDVKEDLMNYYNGRQNTHYYLKLYDPEDNNPKNKLVIYPEFASSEAEACCQIWEYLRQYMNVKHDGLLPPEPIEEPPTWMALIKDSVIPSRKKSFFENLLCPILLFMFILSIPGMIVAPFQKPAEIPEEIKNHCCE